MISLDTNILFPALVVSHPDHGRAAAFVDSIWNRSDVAISELILVELYNLLRNVLLSAKPLSPSEAVDVCETFRQHPYWQLIGFPPDSRTFHDAFWPQLRTKHFARRRTFDWRIALSLIQQGVTGFATVNVRDFEGFGFARVWNPLIEAPH